MDATTAVGAVLAAFGLAGAAGLNAWLPLFGAALLNRLEVVELAAPFDELSTTAGLIVLATLTALDLIGDKVPAVDHALHTAGTVIAPIVRLPTPGCDATCVPRKPSSTSRAPNARVTRSIAGRRDSASPTHGAITRGGAAIIAAPIASLPADTARATVTASTTRRRERCSRRACCGAW